MNCPSGQTSIKEGSTTATDGCGECALDSSSSGDENTESLPQVCPVCYKATKIGVRTENDRCKNCPAGKITAGGAATQ